MKVLFATSELSPVASVGGLAVAAAGLVARAARRRCRGHRGAARLRRRRARGRSSVVARRPAVGRTGRRPARASSRASGPSPSSGPTASSGPTPTSSPTAPAGPTTTAGSSRSPPPSPRWPSSSGPTSSTSTTGTPRPRSPSSFPRPPTVLTIHNLAYQGGDEPGLAARLPALPGGLRPRRRLQPAGRGHPAGRRHRRRQPDLRPGDPHRRGRHGPRRRPAGSAGPRSSASSTGSTRPSGTRPTTATWPRPTPGRDMAGKAAARRAVLDELGLPDLDGPLVVMVSRLVEQKGVDLLAAGRWTWSSGCPLQVAVLGDGDAGAGRRRWPRRPRASRSGSRSGRATTRAWPTASSPAATSSPCRAASSRAAWRRCRPCATARCRSSPTSAGCTTRSSTSTTARGTGPGSWPARPTSLAVLDALHRGVRAHAAPARRKAMQTAGHDARLVVGGAGPTARRALRGSSSPTRGSPSMSVVPVVRSEPKVLVHRPRRRRGQAPRPAHRRPGQAGRARSAARTASSTSSCRTSPTPAT